MGDRAMEGGSPAAAYAAGMGSASVGGDNYGCVSTNVHSGHERLDDAYLDPESLYQAADLDRFSGRTWLTRSLDRFLATEKSGFFLVESEAGLGKTTFAAWLARTRNYPVHFARFEGTRSVAAARKNLAVQLIRRWNLVDLAPNGVLPAASIRIEWFEQVLRSAARSRDLSAPDTPIVLVLDGLDEMRNLDPEDGLGLPRRLPPGVYIMATCRKGNSDYYLYWQPYGETVIRAESDENRDDMHAFLRVATREPRIAEALLRAGMPADQTIRILMDRCAGVWIYLRFVLDEIRQGLRDPRDLASLPTDLWLYYAQNVQRLRADESAWSTCYLPVLASLTAAGEPLTAELIDAFTGAGRSRIERFLGEKFRPFCHAIGGERERYELYHTSLRDFLYGELPRGHPLGGEPLRAELGAAARQANNRIADRYLGVWGGLRDGLPALQAAPQPGLVDGGYGLRHIVAHLEATRRYADIHRLLGCVRKTAPVDGYRRTQHLWFAVHDFVGDHDGYLDDIERARTLAAHMARNGPREDRQGLSALAVRYALISASFNSIAQLISPQFAAVLVQSGVWTPRQALAYAGRVPRQTDRARAYLRLARELPEPYRTRALERALAAVAEAPASAEQAEIVVALSGHLPPALIETAALPFAVQHGQSGLRVAMIDSLLAALPPGRQAVAAGTLMHQALVSHDSDETVALLIAVAPYLSDEDAIRAGRVVRRRAGPQQHAAMAVALGGRLPDPAEVEEISRAAVLSVRAVVDTSRASDTLLQMAGRLPVGALASIAGGGARLENHPAWGLIVQRTAANLPDELAGRVLDTMFEVPGTPRWMAALEAVAPKLDAPTLGYLLGNVDQLDPVNRIQIAMIIAPYLPPALRGAIGRLALGAAEPQARAVLTTAATSGRAPHPTRDLRDALAASSMVNDAAVVERTVGVLRAAGRRASDAAAATPGRSGPGAGRRPEYIPEPTWINELTESMAAMTRTSALTRLDGYAMYLASLGEPAVHGVVQAVRDVGNWWP